MRHPGHFSSLRQGALLLGLIWLAGCEPSDRRPGTWLSGEPTPSSGDWNFVRDHNEVFVETRPWYGIPFSVTTVIGTRDGKLYVPSIYEEELPFPGTKYWNSVIAENPDVRVKIGNRLYDMRAMPVEDPVEFQTGLAALAEKYDAWRRWQGEPDTAPPFVIIRMEAR